MFSSSFLPFIPQEADSEIITARMKLKDLFEEHLKTTFPDQTFPEIKLETVPAAPPDSQLLCLDNEPHTTKRQRTGPD